MEKLATWCGVVAAVSWVLLMGHACFVYQQSRSRGYNNPCGVDPPRYPNQMFFETLRDFPFVTTDSRAEITDYYYRSGPEYLIFEHSYAHDWNRSVASFALPIEAGSRGVSCATGYLEIYDYGFFRIVTLYYWVNTWDPVR